MAATRAQRELAIARFSSTWANARPVTRARVVEFLVSTYDRFIADGLSDPNFTKGLLSPSETTHTQRLSEMLLADMLWQQGFSLASSASGPDLRATKDGRSVWVELITPAPNGIDDDFHHQAINLRWTSAIREKWKKLVGNPEKGAPGYLAQGIVGQGEPYVIAVNQQLLHGSFPSLTGISQRPIPVEVLFAVGPQQLSINKATGKVVGRSHQLKAEIERPNRGPVSTGVFLDSSFAPVSAVLGLDFLVASRIEREPDQLLATEHLSVFAHNPLATNPLGDGWIAVQEEWRCSIDSDGHTPYRV